MGKKRDRYEITGNMSANGKSLKGVILVDLGACSASGKVKTDDGKKLLKSDLTHRKFRIEDPKVARSLKLPKELWEYVYLDQHVPVFLTKQTEES